MRAQAGIGQTIKEKRTENHFNFNANNSQQKKGAFNAANQFTQSVYHETCVKIFRVQ